MIELSKKITACVAALLFGLTLYGVLYCWAYTFALGIEGKIIFTYNDYMSVIIGNLSIFIVAIMVIVIFFLFLPRTEGFHTEDELVSQSSNPEKTKRMREAPHVFFDKWIVKIIAPVILVLFIISFFLLGTNFLIFDALYFSVFILIPPLIIWYFKHPNCPHKISLIYIVMLSYFLSFAVYFTFSGYEDAIERVVSQVWLKVCIMCSQP